MAVKTLRPGLWQGEIMVPPSKSVAHRALILSALTGGEGPALPVCEDIRATGDCLKGLLGTGEFPCGESGSTLRFMIPLALALRGGGHFTGAARLARRPLKPYEACLQATFEYGPGESLELTLRGTLEAGVYTLPGNVSSQFVTGLLLALPLVNGDSQIRLIPPVESAGYIDLTLEAMAAFGFQVERPDPCTFRIPGGQKGRYVPYPVEGDYSQAAVFLCAAALGSPVTLRGLQRQTCQGDARILDFLEKMGAGVTWVGDRVTVTAPQGLNALEAEGSQCPDIMPILALTCALARGESRLKNLARLRLKECDRLQATCQSLNLLGGCARVEGDDLVIRGVQSLRGGVICPDWKDHRMVMMLAAAATRCREPIGIEGAGAVAKSWPGFWEAINFPAP